MTNLIDGEGVSVRWWCASRCQVLSTARLGGLDGIRL
jgi:hypothetical protein